MTAVPNGWNRAALGDVCRVVSGATPKTSIDAYWGGDVRWLTPADMSRDRSQVLQGGDRTLTAQGYKSCGATLFPAGSVVVSSRAPVGYVAIAGNEMCTNQGCKTAVPPEFIEPKYLYWYLTYMRPDLESRASGTTFKEISKRRFAETTLLWPSLGEQRRIVELLEDHLSRLDAADAGLAGGARRLTALKRAVLADLHDGDSVPLAELAWDSGYGTSEKCVADGPGAPVVRIPNLVNGAVDLTDEKRVADASADVSSAMLAAGDLLIVRTNGSVDLIGRSAVVQDGVDAAFASYLIRYRIREDLVRPAWVQAMLSTPQVRRTIEPLAASSAGQHNLSLSKLDPLALPVPPLPQQDAGLARLREVDANAQSLRSEIGRARSHAAALRRSLLAAAFSGQLTTETAPA